MPRGPVLGVLAAVVVLVLVIAIVLVRFVIVHGRGPTTSTPPVASTAPATTAPPVATATAPVTSGGCQVGGVVAPCIGSTTAGQSGWGTPAFDDEFSGDTLNSAWASTCPEFGNDLNGGTSSASNVAVTGGDLVLTQGSWHAGACVSTRPGEADGNTGFTFRYGYAEARIYFPGNGTSIYNWPAFWTGSAPWPQHGEIDIAEGLGGQLSTNYHGGYRCDCRQGATYNQNKSGVPGYWSSGFHTYGVDREPGVNTVYWDGQQVAQYHTTDGGAPEWFLLNVGDGKSGGKQVIGAASRIKVDYVRWWNKP
jgi:beta-glucanase (GH16 family)